MPCGAQAFEVLPQVEAANALLAALNTAPPVKALKASGPVVVAGRSEDVAEAERLLARLAIPIAGAIDTEALGSSPVVDTDPRTVVAVADCTRPFEELAERLRDQGHATVAPFDDVIASLRDRHPVNGGWAMRHLTRKDLQRMQAVMGGWADGLSRAHHLQFAAWRMRRSEWRFDGAPVGGEAFFPHEVRAALPHDARLLDVGAFHGAIVSRFMDRPGGQFGRVWAIEPDPTARAILEATVAAGGRDSERRVSVLPHVVGATGGPVPFVESFGPYSQCGDGGSAEREMVTIDDMALDPSFLTIDVNGHEISVLDGATATLAGHRPIVAIDVSGGPDGLWRTARWLMRTLKEYRFLMRLHAWQGRRAIVYALPEERSAPLSVLS